MEIYSIRKWGEPKLKKPKECNNKTLLGSVDFDCEKSVKCKVWLSEDIVYVLHRNYESYYVSYPEAKRMGLKATHNGKFVYNDNFGGVILRGECLLTFAKPDLSKFILDNRFNLIKEFAEVKHQEWYELYELCRWEDFFERVLKLLVEKDENNCVNK